jgi:DNA-binding CsgD family transcriptional regulator
MDVNQVFWDSSLEELKRGFLETDDNFICLLCGENIEKGLVYPEEGKWYQAEKYMRVHIERVHVSVFHYLIHLDKKLTGLTEHQNHLLRLFYEGRSDAEVQKELGIGSASTIRNHRFTLKEKERQARIFLTMMELLKERDLQGPAILPLPKTAKRVDERFNVTETEAEKIIKKYFPEGINGPLKAFPPKEKLRWVVLREIVKRLELQHIYEEKELNEVLKSVYSDYVLIRRFLIEYDFIDRKADGSEYWVKG